MQSVDKKWYIGYHWVALAIGAVLCCLVGINLALPKLLPVEILHHIGLMTGVLGAIQTLYAVLVYNRIAKRAGHWEAMLLLTMIQATTAFSLVETTGRMESIFQLWWAIIVFMSGMFGMYWIAGTVCVTVIYFILSTVDAAGHAIYTTASFVVLGALFLSGGIGYVFWRRLYVDQDSARVESLTGKLKTNEKQSELLVQSLTDGVLLLNTEGQISLMNPAAALMTGWTIEEGTGTDFRLVLNLHKEDGSDLIETENPLIRIFTVKTPSTETLQLVSRQGKQIIVSLVTSAVIDQHTNTLQGAIAVIRDVSVSRQEEKQRAEFISTASHEMRTPVAAIEGYLALAMNDKVSKIDPKARGFLEKAHESTQHLGKLFQDLLLSSKAEDGRIVSHPEVIEMGAFVEKLAESFKFSAEKKGLLTDFIFGTSVATTGSRAGEHIVRPLYNVYVDPDRLREVVTNLFDNAVKYTPSGKISVGLTGNDDVVQVYVRDTGPGIPAEDLPHLFQKFYRVDNSATRTIGGTGLGLFICRKIVELYKGRIWVESTLGEGSTFYINLPRLSTQKATELQNQQAQTAAPEPVTSLTTPV